MISDEWEEEYYVKVNEEKEQVEVRFFSKVDRPSLHNPTLPPLPFPLRRLKSCATGYATY